MAVVAIKALRKMRGGSQSQLMLCADERLWVVKFQNNPQGVRILANELIASRLIEALGLSVPMTDLVEVPTSVTEDPDMTLELQSGRRAGYLPGHHFGSLFMGGLMPGLVVDYLPEDLLVSVPNLNEFAGILAVDKWTGNCDGRQAVFYRNDFESDYRASFIDHGFCFNAGNWNFPDSPLRGAYARNTVYADVKDWTSFEPWLSRIEAMDWATLSQIAKAVPTIWYGDDPSMIERLMEDLFERRGRVRELIAEFRDSEREPFPLWTSEPSTGRGHD